MFFQIHHRRRARLNGSSVETNEFFVHGRPPEILFRPVPFSSGGRARPAGRVLGARAPVRACALLLLACGLTACAPGEVQAAPSRLGQVSADIGRLPLLERIASAPSEVRHAGRRRVELHYRIGDRAYRQRFIEHVASDGRGAFSVRTLEVEDPGHFGDAMTMRLLNDARAAFVFRYRDFRVREPRTFAENYSVTLGSGEVLVAGIPCLELGIRRRTGAPREITASVDPSSGLILCWEERDREGELVARVEFLELELGGDLSDAELQSSRGTTRVIAPVGDPGLGFELLRPTLPPAGFVLEEAVALEDTGGKTWAKLVFGDGAEQLIYMQSTPVALLAEPCPGASPTGGQTDSSSIGIWRTITRTVEGTTLLLMGRLPEEQLLEVLESALTNRQPRPGAASNGRGR